MITHSIHYLYLIKIDLSLAGVGIGIGLIFSSYFIYHLIQTNLFSFFNKNNTTGIGYSFYFKNYYEILFHNSNSTSEISEPNEPNESSNPRDPEDPNKDKLKKLMAKIKKHLNDYKIYYGIASIIIIGASSCYFNEKCYDFMTYLIYPDSDNIEGLEGLEEEVPVINSVEDIDASAPETVALNHIPEANVLESEITPPEGIRENNELPIIPMTNINDLQEINYHEGCSRSLVSPSSSCTLSVVENNALPDTMLTDETTRSSAQNIITTLSNNDLPLLDNNTVSDITIVNVEYIPNYQYREEVRANYYYQLFRYRDDLDTLHPSEVDRLYEERFSLMRIMFDYNLPESAQMFLDELFNVLKSCSDSEERLDYLSNHFIELMERYRINDLGYQDRLSLIFRLISNYSNIFPDVMKIDPEIDDTVNFMLNINDEFRILFSILKTYNSFNFLDWRDPDLISVLDTFVEYLNSPDGVHMYTCTRSIK